MLRNKPRKANIATLPFRICNNFRRLPNRFLLSDNDDNEKMVQKDFEDDNISGEEYNEYGDGDDDLEQRSDDDHIEQRSDNGDDLEQRSDDDHIEQRSDNGDDLEQRSDDDHIEQRSDNGDDLEQRSNDDHLEQRSDNDHLEQRNDNDDDLEQRSNNEEGDTNMISTSSENETESDYIMSLESDEEYETMSSDNEERHDSDISEEKLFVDEALAKDKLPSYDGDFAPYFQNLTTAALFCWIYKHNISTNAYEDLVDIIMRPEFNRDHIMAYQLSISDIIWNVLNNPSLLKEMYFGAGVDSKTKSEYWHGTLWAESPLFGQEQLMISGEIYQCGDFVYYYDNERKLGRLRAILLNEENQQYRLRIQKVLDYSDLPGTFKGELRQNRSLSGEVWLQDEPFLTITTSQISEKVAADTLRITEILYKHHTHWRIRDATFSYQHPSEYISIRQPPSSTIPVYKLFLDIYYDDFGTFRNVYHSLGGVYVQFGNMPARQRKLLKNHFVLGFVPFGGNFNEFMLPFISEMKEFEQGKLMEVNGQDAWVIAGLGVVTADLPQGNDMCGVLRHNANKGCRTCTASQESLTNFSQDVPATSRYHHITDDQFKEIFNEPATTRQRRLCTKFGLRTRPSILDRLLRERHLQTPQDVYHATAGKIGRLLKLTCELFSQKGEDEFIKAWKNFEKPKKWSRLPNPISHNASFMMSDYLRLAMIMPFILNSFLETSSLKENESRSILRRIQESRINMAKNVIIACWVYVAKTMRMVFESKFTLDSYDELQKCLEEEMKILPKVFPEFANLPNLHINIHLLVHARTYGTLINTQVGIKEMVHQIFKAMVPQTNCKNVELDLLKRYTTLFAIRHLVDGGADQRLSQPCRGFATMSSNFRNLLTNWYITEDKVSNEQEPEENEEAISSPVDFITNIILKRSLSRQDRENIMKNLPNFKSELLLSFMDIGQKSALIYSQMGWYELATYTMEESDGVFSKVHLHIGDVVTIHEEDSSECYAIIKGIFKYKGNDDKYYAFITIDWFDNINRIHNVLKCPLFRIQTSQDIRWRRIFPISIIDHVQKVHFVYDTKIDLWIKNNYYFTAI
ncbi:hypothetical protein GLOIN_2v1790940 [Rhizophagus clarus]|uniref:BAH domain-containing protein n=1 Tax=Rhizophagus clarus TaxID=94130 RepID=A0A8H3LMP7_9GLOM|nr:hypothetical protein GLOIN_2v1790940 [Rhizophagus clarus]